MRTRNQDKQCTARGAPADPGEERVGEFRGRGQGFAPSRFCGIFWFVCGYEYAAPAVYFPAAEREAAGRGQGFARFRGRLESVKPRLPACRSMRADGQIPRRFMRHKRAKSAQSSGDNIQWPARGVAGRGIRSREAQGQEQVRRAEMGFQRVKSGSDAREIEISAENEIVLGRDPDHNPDPDLAEIGIRFGAPRSKSGSSRPRPSLLGRSDSEQSTRT